ncbi:MAG: DUF4838 domain-containing protein, partial [bacterium]|nr:DUF4838 domain-containing protein [bacterium]
MKRLGAILFAISLTVFAVSCGPKPAETPTPTAVPEPVVEAEPTAPAEPAGPCIVKDGVSEYRVVLSPDASPSEKKAAMELAAYINTCTGAELPVVEAAGDADPTGAPMLVVGFGPAATALGVDASDYDLGEQGYVLKTADANVVIAGTPAAGTLYGVMDFLESQVGVRWHAPGATKTPKLEQLPLPQLDAVVKPAFEMRDTTYAWPGGDAAFRAQQRENAGGAGPDGEWGVQHAHHGRCHTYFSYISPGAYFDEHPEYFSEIGGVRQREETQLCLTNPEVLDIVTEKMLANMEAKPNYRQYNFSQMDWYSVCECEKCRAMNDQYAADGGTQYWFCNQLAERTSKVYPDKLIGTLAYMYTEEAPKGLEIHPNVAVWLCHMFPCCDSHPIATCELNADYKRRAQEWSKLCSHLYIWHYVVDFAHYYNPFPNFRAMAADMKFYRDIGVEGMFLQGMGHPGGGGEFSLLRPYLGMKLLWNPDQDPEVIIKDFLEGYYGAGWEPIWQYITMVHDKVENENIHMHLYTNPSQGYMPDEVLAKARALFDQA